MLALYNGKEGRLIKGDPSVSNIFSGPSSRCVRDNEVTRILEMMSQNALESTIQLPPLLACSFAMK